uniref:SWIM-type domain-containing protein n=1 Tax=Tetranychus urticae TaxID=32264 RepID=A0A158P560_TETUR
MTTTCQCNSGRRTVGCCSHVACLIWYLSTGRHSPIRPPAANHPDSFAHKLGGVDERDPDSDSDP